MTAKLLSEVTFNGYARFGFVTKLDDFYLSSGKKTILDTEMILTSDNLSECWLSFFTKKYT